MANVNLSWAVEDRVIPNAADFIQYIAQIRMADGTVVQSATTPLGVNSADFAGVAPGAYQAAVSLVDAAGNLAVPELTADFIVPPEATAPVPVTLSVVLS